MTTCRTCETELPEGASHCPDCGAGEDGLRQAATRPDTTPGRPAPAEPEDPCRVQFTAGTVLAQRYRVLDKLGSGGLGTVYRAEDTRLRQEVALKFMAERCVHTEESVELLLNEVRLARRVTHPNVCRVHDLGEIDGVPFISMEYVDGEDLSALLRRIGHLPSTKAIEVARQICSGLQGAHEQGVLHQDLKPANVMIDGRGDAKITDFGIAAARDEPGERESSSGTPAYMAPELFTGARPSVQSDLYSLGLLLHELFTGQRMFSASTMTELLRQHRAPVVPPSHLVEGMDAGVERAILTCLERDPKNRPRSAMEVLAALPGGDPLAESLAAGRTPSPELIAASGGSGRLPMRVASVLAGVIGVGLALILWLEPQVKLISRAELPRSGEVLADRAAEKLSELGLAGSAAHGVYGFEVFREYLAEIAARPDATHELWTERLGYGRPAVIDFWYRTAPDRLMASNVKGRVTWNDPPSIRPGAVQLRLDPEGRLRELVVVPQLTNGGAESEMDWAALFAAADLDIDAFSPVDPMRIPRSFADQRAAWRGVYPEAPEIPILIEAAALGGQPVAFHISETRWPDTEAVDLDRTSTTSPTWRFMARVGLILCAIGLGIRSLRRGRGDARGAFRFGLTMFSLVVAFTVLTGDHGSWEAVGALLLTGMSHGLAVAIEFSVYYFALEPHVRRIWPESLIPWTRLLGGRLRDPLVGSTILIGLVLGVVSALFSMSEVLLPRWTGGTERPPVMLHPSGVETLMGSSFAIGALLELVVDSSREAMKVFMSLVLLKLILRRPVLVALTSALIWAGVWSPDNPMSSTGLTISWFGTLAFALAFTLVAIRFGLLAIVVGFVGFSVLMSFPLPTDLSVWYGRSTVIALGLIVGAAAFAFRASTRPG